MLKSRLLRKLNRKRLTTLSSPFQFDQSSSTATSLMSCACPKTVSNWFDSLKRRLALRDRNAYAPLEPDMVQGIEFVQVDVAFLTYNPKRNVDNPSVKLDNTCRAGFFELKKHREMKRRQKNEMGPDAYKHYKWYNLMLRTELTTAPPDSKLKIIHWHIESGNKDAFKMDGVLYKAVSIIIGPDLEHWYCANIGPNAHSINGSRQRIKSSLPEEVITTTYNLESFRSRNFLDAVEAAGKCSADFCANNCCKCKKAPMFLAPRHSKCACYIEKKFGRIVEEREDGERDDHEKRDGVLVVLDQTPLESKKDTLLRSCSPAMLGTIREERLY